MRAPWAITTPLWKIRTSTCWISRRGISAITPIPDLYIGGLTVGSDCRYGGGIHCKEMNGSIYFTAAKIGDSPLFELAPSGETREVTRVHGSVDCFDVAAGRCVIVGMRDMGLEEVYSLNLADGSETALTDWNGPYIRSHAVVRPQPLFFPQR